MNASPATDEQMVHKNYSILVCAYGLTREALGDMFDRVAEAAHRLDEEVTCIGGVDCDECAPACHCGEPVAFGYDGDLTHHRGMCADCDAVRCDAYPGACHR